MGDGRGVHELIAFSHATTDVLITSDISSLLLGMGQTWYHAAITTLLCLQLIAEPGE